MGDRMFTSEGDSVNVGRLGPTTHADRWDEPRSPRTAGRNGDEAVVAVVRRLQARLDRQLWLLDRMRSEQAQPDSGALPELTDGARRMRRDTESALLICGQDPGLRGGAPRRLSQVLADAAAVAEEPRRVDVRSAPAVTVAPPAAVEFQHVVAELVDHVTAVYPGARVDLASRVEPLGGVTVDVAVDGISRHEPDGFAARNALVAAEQLAQRSRHGIELRRPVGGPPTSGSGLVSSVHCPAGAVTVEETAWPGTSGSGSFRSRANGAGHLGGAAGFAPGRTNGAGHSGGVPATSGTYGAAASGSHGAFGNGTNGYPNGSGANGYSHGANGTGADGHTNGHGSNGHGSNGYGSNGYGSSNGTGGVGHAADTRYGADTGYPGETRHGADTGHAGDTRFGADTGYPGDTRFGADTGYPGDTRYGADTGRSGRSGQVDDLAGGTGRSGPGVSGTGQRPAAGQANGYAGGHQYAASTGSTPAYTPSGSTGSTPAYPSASTGSTPAYAPSSTGSTPAYASSSTGSTPAYSSSSSSQVDELFGPLLDLPLEPIDDRFSTPIFEAIASAWFREDQPEPGPEQRGVVRRRPGDAPDWETPIDQEWRAATERANRPDPEPTTSTGLPRRRPGNQLVPPPLSRRRPPDPGPAERVPDRVRDRLSTYQRGLRQGRHRAPNQDSAEYEQW